MRRLTAALVVAAGLGASAGLFGWCLLHIPAASAHASNGSGLGGGGSWDAAGAGCCTLTGCNALVCEEFLGGNSTFAPDQEWVADNLFAAPLGLCATAAQVTVGNGVATLGAAHNVRANCPTTWDAALISGYGAGNVPSQYDMAILYQPTYLVSPPATVQVKMRTSSSVTGMAPAFWMYGHLCQSPGPFGATAINNPCKWSWDGSAESDNLEIDGFNTSTTMEIGEFLHSQGQAYGGNFSISFDPSAAFHVYATVWTTSHIKQYVDGVLQMTFSTNVPQEAMYVIFWNAVCVPGVNEQCGSSTPFDAAGTPTSTVLDYVYITSP